MKKYLFFISITIIFISIILLIFVSSCKKNKIENYNEEIIAVWKMRPKTNSDFSSIFDPYASHSMIDDKYHSDGTWFSISKRHVRFIDENCYNFEEFDSSSQFISDTLPYLITNDLLIRQRHEVVFDNSTPIVTDTFKIVNIKHYPLRKSVQLILEAKNSHAGYITGTNGKIGDRIIGYKYIYDKKAKSCGAAS